MTPLRQVFHAGVIAAALTASGPVRAELLAPAGPPPPPLPTVVEAPVLAAPAPSALPVATAAAPKVAKPAPGWLAPRPAPKAASGKSALPSAGRMIGLLVVLGGLGGAALYLKRRGKGEKPRLLAQSRLSVLSSTRIGPKAHAVVIQVAGRQMLLGVTDSSVKRLAFIDEEEETRERDLPRRLPQREPATRPLPKAVRSALAATAPSRSFGDLLKTAFGRREPEAQVEPAAASLLAAETQDFIGGKPVPSSLHLLDVEGQAKGLIARLSGPRA